jgi:hypothetical protein
LPSFTSPPDLPRAQTVLTAARAASLKKRFGKAEPERSLLHTQIAHHDHHPKKTLAKGFFGFTAGPFQDILNLLAVNAV